MAIGEPLAQRTRSPLMISGTIGASIGLLIAAIFGVRELAQSQWDAAFQPTVEVMAAAAGAIRSELVYTGVVQAPQQATVTALSAGTLLSLSAEVGTSVHAGERIASLATESLPAQLQQAQADLVAAQARRTLVLGGARGSEVDSARAVLAAADARLAQLMQPSATDIAAARSALATAESALASGEATVENNRALVLGAIANACSTPVGTGIPVPCSGVEVPLPASVVDALAGFLQSRAGDRGTDLGARAVAVLTANGAYRSSVTSVAASRETVAAARAKLDALQNPSAADLAAQRAQVEVARNGLDSKQNPYNDADTQAAHAAVARAQAQVAIMEASIARTSITAPFDGVIAQRLVDPGANVTPQTPLFVVAAKGAEVHVTLRDTDATAIKPGVTVEVTAPGVARPLAGRVGAVAPLGDPRAHTLDVTVRTDNPEGTLRPGTLAQVRLITTEKAGVVAVPTSAVILEGLGTRVFVVVDGRARSKDVTIGIIDRANSEVTQGLKPGDVVIVRGHTTLHEGQPVKTAPSPRS